MLKRLNEVNTVDSYYNQNEVSDIKKCNLKRGGGILTDVQLLRQINAIILKCLILQKEF